MISPLLVLLGARGLRDFGDGFVAVLLPVYLMALGFSPLEVGALAGTALFGSALLTLAVGFLGVRYDHRLLLISSAGLMLATGIALSIVDSYALLLVVAFVGSVNPSGGSASSFVPVEHAVLTRETADAERTKAFARYGLIGGLASAGGALAAAMPELFTRPDWSELSGIKAMFGFYALLGLVGGLLYTRIPGRMPPTQHDQSRRFRGWICRPVAFGSLVIRTIRSVAFGCEPLLLLVGGPFRFLFSRRSIAFEPVRARQHHGLHTYPLEPVPYPRDYRAIAYHGARLVARAGGVVADGCADALLLCDGGRD
jgi:MFS family permease